MDIRTLVMLAIGVAVLAKVLWELCLSPLARQGIPGPKRAAVSDIWYRWLQVSGQCTFTFHSLFEVSVCYWCRNAC